MRSKLSISRAWEETKGRVASDGRLFVIVALALVALPSAISTFVNPQSQLGGEPQSVSTALVVVLTALVAMIGQLAIVRLALGPGISVGESIRHALSRLPSYIGAGILIILVLLAFAIPLIAVLAATGVDIEAGGAPPPPLAWLAILLFVIVAMYFALRMLLTSSVAVAEPVGPLGIIKRSWQLTAGHGWKLLGFLLLFIIAAAIALMATGMIAALLARLLFGEIEPLTASALVLGLIQGVASAAATGLFAIMLARMYVQLAGDEPVEASVPSTGT